MKPAPQRLWRPKFDRIETRNPRYEGATPEAVARVLLRPIRRPRPTSDDFLPNGGTEKDVRSDGC